MWNQQPGANYEQAVNNGLVPNAGVWNKFGYNLNVPNSATEQIIASWGGAFDPNSAIMATAQTFTITYNNATDGAGQTGATSLLIIYLDSNYQEAQAIVPLDNTGSVVTSFTGYGINRGIVLSSGGAGWNVNTITITATGDGTTQAQIPALGSVTQQAIFHTPKGYNFNTSWLLGDVRKVSGAGSDVRYTIKGYSWSRVTNIRYEVFRYDGDTRSGIDFELNPGENFIVGGREVLYFTVNSDTNNTVCNLRFSGKLIKPLTPSE